MGVSGLYERHFASALNTQEVTHFFMECGKLVTYAKGTALYAPGELSDKIFCINHGEIKISRSTNDGKEIILDLLGPGAVFGEVETVSELNRKNTAVAKKDTILHCVTKSTLEERMSQDPRIALWMVNKVCQKQMKTENLLENLLFKSANAKVANVLLDLAKTHGVMHEQGILIDYLITHQEIGNTIATTRETVSYAFMEFRQMGLIDTVKRRTIILDKEALERVAAD